MNSWQWTAALASFEKDDPGFFVGSCPGGVDSEKKRRYQVIIGFAGMLPANMFAAMAISWLRLVCVCVCVCVCVNLAIACRNLVDTDLVRVYRILPIQYAQVLLEVVGPEPEKC